MRGSGSYSSDKAKENAHLKKELKDTRDALEVLKKDRHTGKIGRRVIYQAVDEMSHMSPDFSISSVLRILHVSRTVFYAYRNHKTTRSLRHIDTTEKVIAIYNESNGIYCSPKINEGNVKITNSGG